MITKMIKKNAIFTFISICLIIAGLAAAITFMPVTTYAMVQAAFLTIPARSLANIEEEETEEEIEEFCNENDCPSKSKIIV